MIQSGLLNEDLKLAGLLNEEEYWSSLKQEKNKDSACLSRIYYIKIKLQITIHCLSVIRISTKKQICNL